MIACEGGDLSEFDPRKYYSQQEIDAYLQDIVEGRRKFTEEITSEGLNPEIIKFAEKSFEIAKSPAKKSVFIPAQEEKTDIVTTAPPPGSWIPKSRPPRPAGYR